MALYPAPVIKGYKNAKTRKVHETGMPKGFKGLDGEWSAAIMDMLNANDGISDLPALASYHLHPLKGDRKGQWAMTVNKRWRVVFTPLDDNGFGDVEITDYHKG